MKIRIYRFFIGWVILAMVIAGCNLQKPGTGTNTPAASATLPAPTANRNPIVADMQRPKNGGSYPTNGNLPVSVALNSRKPIQLVQVWLDGELLTDSIPPAGAKVANLNLPASVLQGDGLHTLVVIAVDADGRSAPTNVVRLKGIPPVPAAFVITTQGGESLQSIAAHFNQDLSQVMSGNPQLVLKRQISTGREALPANLQVVVPLGPPPTPGPEKPAGELHTVAISPGLPEPPTVSTQVAGCEVGITVGNTSDKASGYTLYRLDPDKAQFVKVADIPPSEKNEPISIKDQAAYGNPEYYVSAYNDNGETLSPLQGVTLTDPQCQNPSDLAVDDGILHLPADVDKVYLYVSVNKGEYNRWPEKQGEFLTPQNGSLDLHALTDTLVNPNTYTNYPFNVQAEVWAWSYNELTYLGKVSARLDASTLVVCNLIGTCTGDVGKTHNLTAIQVGSDSPKQVREFTWTSSIPNTSTALFQLSLAPFPAGYDANPIGLVYSQLVAGSGGSGGSSGSFQVDFAMFKKGLHAALQTDAPLVINQPYGLDKNNFLTANLGWVNPSNAAWTYSELSNTALQNQIKNFPMRYYGRIIPMNGSQPSGPVSNMVTVDYLPLGPASTIQMINDVPPQIYDVQIGQNFSPPIPPTLWWGCVDIVSVNPDSWWWKMPVVYPTKAQFIEAMNKNWAYCPSAWKGIGEKPWYEQMWDAITDVFTWIAKAYESIKDAVVSVAAFALNQIPPGGLCGDSCQKWLKEGLEAGLAALGIPPEFPDLNKLTDEGIAALVEEGANAMGFPCDSTCKDVLSQQLHDLKDQMTQQQVASYSDAGEAHDHGVNPLPLPPADALTVVPAAAATWQMATTTVTVTRHADSGQYSSDELRNKYNYHVVVDIEGRNDWMVGQTIPVATAIACNDASCWPDNYLNDPVTEPLTGQLFTAINIPIPNLAPGESQQITLVLIPTEWWYKDHKKYAGNTWKWANEWSYLWYHGTGTLTAAIYADGIQAGMPYAYPISKDGPWEFDLPLVDVQGMGNPGP